MAKLPKPSKPKFVHRPPLPIDTMEGIEKLFAKLAVPFYLRALALVARYPRPEGYTSAELQELTAYKRRTDWDPMAVLWWENLLDPLNPEEENVGDLRFIFKEKGPLASFFKDKILPLLPQESEETEESPE
jgi:hypothetical protein